MEALENHLTSGGIAFSKTTRRIRYVIIYIYKFIGLISL